MKHKKEKKLVLIKNWCKNLIAQPHKQFYTNPLIYIASGEMEIKNFLQILEYTDTKLNIKTKNGYLNIDGVNLLVRALEKERVLVEGTIFKIEFLPQEEKLL